nr:MAG TPA: hypothetical protein [Caudoviricetes sp.]
MKPIFLFPCAFLVFYVPTVLHSYKIRFNNTKVLIISVINKNYHSNVLLYHPNVYSYKPTKGYIL